MAGQRALRFSFGTVIGIGVLIYIMNSNPPSSRSKEVKLARMSFLKYLQISQRKNFTECNTLKKTEGIKYGAHGIWQLNVLDQKEILVYSAFYDNREIVGESPVVRVLGISTEKKDIFCQLWYDGRDYSTAVLADVLTSGAGGSVNGVQYFQHLYTCSPQSKTEIPSHVSLSFSPCGVSTIYLPVTISIRSNWKVEFGVCVPIAYANIPVDRFIEWMEFNLLMGASEVHVYNGTVSGNIRPVFNLYEKEQILTVHPIPPPTDAVNWNGVALGSPASINDCILRYMYRYRYVLVIDFDENIVPRNTTNYHDMLQSLIIRHPRKVERPVYTFRNTYFLVDFEGDGNYPEYLQMFHFRKRAPPNGLLFSPKSMIDPRKCLSAFNHYCWKQFLGLGRFYDVGTKAALSHHYRLCNLNKRMCDTMVARLVTDDAVMFTFKQMSENVNKRRRQLGIL